jgi:DNA-directed RNA polymerase subunit beta
VARGPVRYERPALRLPRPPQAPPQVPATTFLRALGYGSDEEIINLFYKVEDLKPSARSSRTRHRTKVLIGDVRDGEITVARAFEPLTKATVRQILALGVKSVKVVDTKDDDTIIKSLKKDPAHDEEEALKDIYRRLRPGDPPPSPTPAACSSGSSSTPRSTTSAASGRYKINQKLGINVDLGRAHHDQRGLHRRDQVPHPPPPQRRLAR